MTTNSRVMNASLGLAICAIIFAAHAYAQCGVPSGLTAPLDLQQAGFRPVESPALSAQLQAAGSADSPDSASIVGMWKFTFVSQNNSTHNPPIPDGVTLDFGYAQWHSDGTEFTNSGGRAPATQNFCLGVWRKSTRNTYQLNHFALSYDAITGVLNARVNIHEEVALGPGGNSFAGIFTIDVYDLSGNHVDHIGGRVTGERVTIDSTIQ